MSLLDSIKIYLPKYLSDEKQRQLFSELKSFPKNIDERFYSNILSDTNIIYQGDCIDNIQTFDLPRLEIKEAKNIVLSNTCDLDLNNNRHIPSKIVFSPLIALNKITLMLRGKKVDSENLNAYITSIREQRVTNAFYFPEKGEMPESVVFFDRCNSLPNNSVDRNNLQNTRFFSLSNYGFYIFLIKISIHFSRVKDGVLRG